jgi:2-polyprenyl-3-methyl-5-hydroxy-6-metoxy-1,4-benzoquinol methylase
MNNRNYDAEAKSHPNHLYAYAFDYLMHDYMLRTFAPLLREGSVLELGCFEGNFTRLLEARFPAVDVVDASADCIAVASVKSGPSVRFVHSRFETFDPVQGYDNIFLIHTLEHLDRPVEVLRRVSNWLAEGGRLFVAVPNARAASRQIAVEMGLLAHTEAITQAEVAQGHRITYAFDTLGRDLKAAGLNIVTTGGVFFKGLANFQIDAALKAGILSKAYMDGCFALGLTYPDLCSSIYAVCEAR